MERQSSREDIDSVNGQSKSRRTDRQTAFFENRKGEPTLADYALTHDRIEALKKYIDDSQKPRGAKQLKNVCKNFIDKCPPVALDVLIDRTYQQFFKFMRTQKRMDEQKMKKIASLAEEWEESSKKQRDWRAPMQKYFDYQKSKNSRRGW